MVDVNYNEIYGFWFKKATDAKDRADVADLNMSGVGTFVWENWMDDFVDAMAEMGVEILKKATGDADLAGTTVGPFWDAISDVFNSARSRIDVQSPLTGSPRDIRLEIEDDNIFRLFVDGRESGSASVSRDEPGNFDIARLLVDPEGTGLGTIFVDELVKYAEEHGFSSVSFIAINPASVRIGKKLGFEVVSFSGDAPVMKKTIGDGGEPKEELPPEAPPVKPMFREKPVKGMAGTFEEAIAKGILDLGAEGLEKVTEAINQLKEFEVPPALKERINDLALKVRAVDIKWGLLTDEYMKFVEG